jgi:hypothetical protein
MIGATRRTPEGGRAQPEREQTPCGASPVAPQCPESSTNSSAGDERRPERDGAANMSVSARSCAIFLLIEAEETAWPGTTQSV